MSSCLAQVLPCLCCNLSVKRDTTDKIRRRLPWRGSCRQRQGLTLLRLTSRTKGGKFSSISCRELISNGIAYQMRLICLLKPTLLQNENNPGRNHFSWSFETQHAWNFPHLRKKEFSINDSIMVRRIHPPMKYKLENYRETGLNRQGKNAIF